MSRNERRQAAALCYDRARDRAPRMVAAGRGETAERIIALARKHGIPLHSDPALVGLLGRLEIDEQIPVNLYRAIAEILVFVHSANDRYRDELVRDHRKKVPEPPPAPGGPAG